MFLYDQTHFKNLPVDARRLLKCVLSFLDIMLYKIHIQGSRQCRPKRSEQWK